MKLSNTISVFVLGLYTVNAVPYQYDTLVSRNHTSGLEHRAIKPAAPEILKVGPNNCLNVPMLYAAFMDTATGYYERYQCDSGSIPIHTVGTLTALADRQLATKELISCMDINLISKKGAIKTHIPFSVCPLLKGYDGIYKPSSLAVQDFIALKYSISTLMRNHLAGMSPFTTVVVHGPHNEFTVAETKAILADLFGINFNGIPLQAKNQDPLGSITRVSLSPPQLFIDEHDAKIVVP